MKGVAARYPAKLGTRVLDLEQRINLCHTGQQKAAPYPFENHELLALSAYIGRQSRGEPIAIDEARLEPTIEMGRKIFFQRQGQLSLACAQCHNDHWDRQLAGSTIGQAHPTGYPIYRLEWQSLGSLQRRLRNCMVGMRAEPYAFGSPEFVALETFLMWRARRMKLETPAVRP
jgi:sulfur-oxidizing protein SoxA